jgi:hypothetical protein
MIRISRPQDLAQVRKAAAAALPLVRPAGTAQAGSGVLAPAASEPVAMLNGGAR